MKTIIAGSRGIEDYDLVKQAIADSNFDITEIVSGCARGVDRLGERWGKENNIPVAKFPANWEEFGRGAGYIRNREMSLYADALIAIWDGESKGTANMISEAASQKLNMYVHSTGGA